MEKILIDVLILMCSVIFLAFSILGIGIFGMITTYVQIIGSVIMTLAMIVQIIFDLRRGF